VTERMLRTGAESLAKSKVTLASVA
jgi:hypothetical protein